MKKILFLIIFSFSLTSFISNVSAQTTKGMLDSLTMIDEDIVKYFPRWKICEPNLQIQIYQAFKILGYPKEKLSKNNITVMAAPPVDPSISDDEDYGVKLLLITCGEATMKAVDFNNNFSDNLLGLITGELTDGKRMYCYDEIPPATPLSTTEANAIIDFLKPSDVTHAFSVSMFDQSLKLGKSGFWISNTIGNDEVGYPFWSAGQAKITLQRPLYANTDSKTSTAIPYLIDMTLGGAYKINSGIDPSGTILSWIPSRELNMGPGGKLVAGLDFSMPFHPQFGVHLNAEIPLKSFGTEGIDPDDYAFTKVPDDVDFDPDNPNYGRYQIYGIVNQLRGTGQATLYYYWWPGADEERYDNFLRFDVGMSYAEVRQSAAYFDTTEKVNFMTPDGITGLQTYKPNEFGDWIYLKLEYRNSAFWPFGISAQYSNQILMGRVYVPLVNWLYIEGKIATPLRPLRPYEHKVFFMVSPVIRLSI